MKIVKVNPLKASSYIEIPEQYKNSKYRLINIKNNDNKCVKWAVAMYFCTDEKNSQRMTIKLKE